MRAHQPVRTTLKSVLASVLAAVLVLVAWFWLPTTFRYHITERYSVIVSDTNTRVFLTVMLPRTGPYQRVENVTIGWEGESSLEEKRDVVVVKLQGVSCPDRNSVAVISYDVVLWQGRARWEGPVEPRQLLPQHDIESDAVAFAQKATELAVGQNRDDAFRIFSFAADSLTWPEGNRTTIGRPARQSALAAYETGQGVCGEFANLAVALCRAAGIPAKSISGLSLPPYPPFWSASRTWGHPGGSHAWIEFHTETGWELADPSPASLLPWKRFWFGRAHGSHLSYGEIGEHEQAYREMTTWAASQGNVIGAMSAPMKFVAASTHGASITPEVTLRMGCADWRWFALLAILFMCLVPWIMRRIRTRHFEGTSASIVVWFGLCVMGLLLWRRQVLPHRVLRPSMDGSRGR